MIYKLINIPPEFRKDEMGKNKITAFDKRTAKKYFTWYMEQKDKRIPILEKAVQTSEGFASWKADKTKDSLLQLKPWFASVVGKRYTTEEEKQQFRGNLPGIWNEVLEDLEWVINKKTDSLCHDVGMYYGEVLIKRNPFLQWGQCYTPKTSVDRNYPVILNAQNKFSFNPYAIMHVIALKNIEHKDSDWEEVYTIWEQEAKKKY